MRTALAALTLVLLSATAFAEAPVAIEKVEVSADKGWRINGKPYFPIMAWLQGPANIDKVRAIGCNTMAGFHRAGKPDGAILPYAEKLKVAGMYFMPPFEPAHQKDMDTLKARHADILLAWMHGDEPDLPRKTSDAKITPAPTLILNGGRPLYLMVDGEEKTSAILDPMKGAQFEIALPADARIKTIALANEPGPKATTAKDVVISLDGKEALKVSLKAQKGLQKFDLPAETPAKSLAVRIDSVEGDSKFGALAEVQALDAAGKNLAFSPVKKVTNQTVEEVQAVYAAFKKFDSSRPILMTTTPFFIKGMEHFMSREMADKMYPGLMKEADVIGFDHYPLYGWNNPAYIPDVSRGMVELKAYGAKGKPMYQWIETKAGGKFGQKAIPVTGVEIRNEVWQAIIHGATAIGYFTHEFQPKFAEFAVPEDNARAITAINAQIVKLTPMLTAGEPAIQAAIAAGTVKAQCMTREADGAVWIVAQTIDPKAGAVKGVVSLAGLKVGTVVEVVDESRTITAGDGVFEDTFDRLATHIYRIKR